jgi:hypothetical protein
VQTGEWLGIVGIAVAGIGLAFNGYGIRRGNQNSSAASLIALNEALRQGWERFLFAKDESSKQHNFAELSNALEIACALSVKRVFVGVSQELLTEYLDDVLTLIDANEDAKLRIRALIHSETTFKYLVSYFSNFRRRQKRR